MNIGIAVAILTSTLLNLTITVARRGGRPINHPDMFRLGFYYPGKTYIKAEDLKIVSTYSF